MKFNHRFRFKKNNVQHTVVLHIITYKNHATFYLVLEPPLPLREAPLLEERVLAPDEYPLERIELPLVLRTADEELLVDVLVLRTADEELLVGVLLLVRVTVVLVLRLGVVVTLVLLGVVAELRVLVVTLVRVGVTALERLVLLLRVAVLVPRVAVVEVLLTRLALPAVRTALLPKVLSVVLLLFTLVALPRVTELASRTALLRLASKARALLMPREALRVTNERSG